MQLVDSHCHLPLIDDAQGIPGIVARARAAGVGKMLCVCVDFETKATIFSATRHDAGIFGSIGVHPNTDTDAHEPSVAEIVSVASDEKIVAIGETGLDYFRSEGDLSWQHNRLRTHIRAARELGKPLIIHCRDAAPDLIKILREENAAEVGGVMHCFVENEAVAKATMDLGFYISFSGIVTFKNAGDLRQVAKGVPNERLLIETDAPWLAPVPHRGKQNEPAFVRDTASFLADLRSTRLEDLAALTTANFIELFKLPATN
ncbi:MAG: TatD family hydrolase [Pseudomonadota bacterium]